MRARTCECSGLTNAMRRLYNLKPPFAKSPPCMYPNSTPPFYIRTVASKYAARAVLEQEDSETWADYPLAFWSRKRSPRQMEWSPREQETYAIINALQKYQSCVGTNRVEILTDHISLEYWSAEHVNTVSGPAGRRARLHKCFEYFRSACGLPSRQVQHCC